MPPPCIQQISASPSLSYCFQDSTLGTRESPRRKKTGSQRVREVERKRRSKRVLCHESPRGKSFSQGEGDSPVNRLRRSRRMQAGIGAVQITRPCKGSLVIFTSQLTQWQRCSSACPQGPAFCYQTHGSTVLSDASVQLSNHASEHLLCFWPR